MKLIDFLKSLDMRVADIDNIILRTYDYDYGENVLLFAVSARWKDVLTTDSKYYEYRNMTVKAWYTIKVNDDKIKLVIIV